MNNKLQTINFTIKPINYEIVSNQFTKCRCIVVASGRNANQSDITIDAIKNSIDSIKNIPVVANLIKKTDGTHGFYVGSHDQKMEIDSNGNLEIYDLTIPYGVVPESCNPEIVEILEPNNLQSNFYLAVDLLLWTGRYNILDAKYSDDVYFHQSCEIEVNDYKYDSDGYLIINDFRFSALCLLGKSNDKQHPEYNSIPCFPSCAVLPAKAKYSLDESKFKEDFALLMQEIKKFNLENSSLDINNTQTELEHNTESVDNNNEEEKNLVNETNTQLNQDLVNAKLSSVINDTKYRSNMDKHYNKYIILSNTDSSVNLIDREDCYKLYSIPYLATETTDGIIVNIDYDNKTEKSFGIVDKTDDIFNIQNEIEMISLDTATFKIAEHQSAAINKLTDDLDSMTDNYNNSQIEIARLKNQLEIFEKEKNEIMTTKHKESIDTLIDSKYEEMKDFSEYSIYRASIDYVKSIEDISNDMKNIHYNFLNSKKPDNKNKFSTIQSHIIGESYDAEYDDIAREYGADVAKFFKKSK